jgi:cyclic beta-1,2-glucan synthetase
LKISREVPRKQEKETAWLWSDAEPLLRAELFGADQMEQHGQFLANQHKVRPHKSPERLLRRLEDNQRVLVANSQLLIQTVKAKTRITPAGEWLLDNFYLISEQIRLARVHLPRNYSRELPCLISGDSTGLPRVYDIALQAVAHGDGRIDGETLSRFVTSYQTVAPLTLGELWAIPIMLRLALIENLRRVSLYVTRARTLVNLAQDWATRMIAVAENDPKSLILVIADMARSNPPLVSAFVAELVRRLQGHGTALALPLNWMEQRLAEESLTTEMMIAAENQQQAMDQVSISNSIGSLRFLGAFDWRVFVETMSLVEHQLRREPGGVYPTMDFATRDSYRQVIDRLAKRSAMTELQIADAALALARNCADQDSRAAHVGYYLVDGGLGQLEQTVAARIPLTSRLRRQCKRAPLTLYLGGTLLLVAAIAGGLWTLLGNAPISTDLLAVEAALVALAVLAATVPATTLINWITTLLVKPRRLPRLDYESGIPRDRATMVVVPCLLTSIQSIDELLEALEVRFLGNRDEHLYFALLTDFTDASTETTSSDEPLLERAREGIEQLNAKYAGESADDLRFLLLNRPRVWNTKAQLWMGYERKRGKLAALNSALRGGDLRGGDHTAFTTVVGPFEALPHIRYIITLDSDTQLPRDAARQFIAVMAHPLNRPRYAATDAAPGTPRIVAGYTILQPRMAASLAGAKRSRYVQLHGSEPGIDPYTQSVSDVYQDLFGEGSFIGKGIYDLDAFEHSLKGQFPDNRILSHDLLEGCYARSGLLSDVHLYEEPPARYDIDVGRRERWIRGDWQIARWLLPRVPAADGTRPNPLNALSRWKIADNLVRSLVPASLLLLLLSGWYLPGLQPLVWTLAVLGLLLAPPLLIAGVEALRKPQEDVGLLQHLTLIGESAVRHLAQAAFRITVLPYEAIFSLVAIARSLWRLWFAPRLLLQWNASAELEQRLPASLPAYVRRMWMAPAIAVIAALGLMLFEPAALVVAMPILALWLLAPLVGWWVSRPLGRPAVALNAEQTLFLRKIARKTWAFFARFVCAGDNWLPPDNFQENPGPVIAHRTSPTNMGMALLANLSAWDLGFISASEMLERTDKTLGSMAGLERHRGHFFNWYDTRTRQPLPPRYISSVDSGNLAGHLLTLRTGLQALPDQWINPGRILVGLQATLEILSDCVRLAQAAGTSPDHTLEAVQISVVRLDAQLGAQAGSLEQLYTQLERFVEMAQELHARLTTHTTPVAAELTTLELINKKPPVDDDLFFWAESLLSQSRAHLAELQHMLPWFGGVPLPPNLTELQEQLTAVTAAVTPPSLKQLQEHYQAMLLAIEPRLQPIPITAVAQQKALGGDGLTQLHSQLVTAAAWVDAQLAGCAQLAEQASAMAFMEFDFLYDRTRHLLAVGYNLDDFRRDNSFYDLLASEARLGTFVAIAQGQLPQESWFALGRLRASTGGDPVLVSWSGSMFEYLMPMLVMPNYDGTLLDQTCRAAVTRQIAYGKQLGLPWGVSESGYYTFDASLNYQYHAFGVPGLGFKRGLAEDVVIAPYASALALMVAPDPACTNMQRLAAMGLEGRFGLYEAVDYTPARLARGATHAVVQSYMAHHQGMSLLAIAHVLLDQPMQRRFAMEPLLRATLMLLQERIPKAAVLHKHIEEDEGSALFDGVEASVHAPIPAETPTPEVHLLSNGRYHLMVTNAGGGYSRCRDIAVTRWREDTTRDHWGMFVYLRDCASGDFWSACHQPTLKRADTYSAIFSEGRAEYRRRDRDIETYTDLVVSPEDNIELRRLRITNRSPETRTLEITSYGEVVLAAPAADDTQSAFSNLFVQTEILPERHAVLCTRRPRSETEQPPWMFHLLASNGATLDAISYETDRLKFIGRGRTLVAPQAVVNGQELSGSQGSVLDPVVAIRVRVTLAPGQVVRLDLITGVADNRAACLAMVGRYQDRHFADRVFELAATHSGVTLRQLNASEADARLYRRLASTILYGQAALRADPGLILQNRRGQSGLWGYAISGDLPIVLLKIASTAHIELARQLIQCHAYWRLKGLAVDLVIWNEDHVGYRQRLQDQILGLIATGSESHSMDRPGGIFVRSGEQISQEDRILLQSVARAIIDAGEGSLAEQLQRRPRSVKKVPRLATTRSFAHVPPRPQERAGLILSNPLGGFTPDGREYIVTTSTDQTTPLPWVNVLANPGFGSVISESGSAYTWSENAHEFRLTPWSSDQVGTAGGEALYVRDEETGHFWSPTPLPRAGQGTYVTRHGFGYSVFKHVEDGIETELCVYVDLHEAVKFSVLKIRNQSGRRRQLSATGYVEWVLGDLRTKSALHLVTEIDATSGALFARNAYNTEFAGRTCFFDVDDNARSLTGDRTEFLGRNGSLANPDAMHRVRLSGRLGAALDPCGAIMVPVELLDGQERQIIFRLGAGRDHEQARALAQRLRQLGSARNALAQVHDYWGRTLGAVRVKTPDPAFDVLANGWLVYQTLACRLWARSGFYQSGGAYGFRDQLQDSMALAHSEPGLMRAQLLRAAQRQYPEGDVQHWWHPPHGRGVRTRCSDDYLWLPLVLCHYVQNTGDHAILDEQLHFLTGRMLNADEESYYDLPGQSSDTASLYQHAVRAIQHGLRFGERGLPLMGSGDWNDGMNLVGIHGKGESVWLGFMLYKVLRAFAELARQHQDPVFADRCLAEAAHLQKNLEQEAWDGDWYRRAWFDDGVALGSAVNDECRIDSIAQSWSVLSGAGDPQRVKRAMNSLDQHLVRRDQGIIQLLDPPFDRSAMNPGYIKGYVPGVRENGGQYTHAAIWAAMAFAELGDSRRAWELFSIINPVNHGQSGEAVALYKAEPYVVAADVYAISPHTGRGGWSWYTGSAGWLYRLMLESLLGITRRGDHLHIKPCLPADWPGCSIEYRFGETLYRIDVQQAHATSGSILLDGVQVEGETLPLVDDRLEHRVVVSVVL